LSCHRCQSLVYRSLFESQEIEEEEEEKEEEEEEGRRGEIRRERKNGMGEKSGEWGG